MLPTCVCRNFNEKVKMEWSNDTTLLFIELYKKKTCLWDPKDTNYKLKSAKSNAWKDICGVLNCSPDYAQKKMDSLLASFRRERNKQTKSVTKTDGAYCSSWFAFKSMLFLMNKFHPRPAGNTVSGEDSQTEEEGSAVEYPAATRGRCKIEEQNEVAFVPITSKKMAKRKEFLSPKRTLSKRNKAVQDSQMERAYRIIQDTVSKQTARDASTIFGEHVAMKHRSYSRYTQNIIEHLISNILFEADMGKYSEHSQPHDIYSALPVTPVLSPLSSSSLSRISS